MTTFRCDGCRKYPHGVYTDSPVVKGYCTFASPGKNPTPSGCLYPSKARNARVAWKRI